MHYCGVVPVRGLVQLVMLEEVRTPEPPIRLAAVFFEPGDAEQVAAELLALYDVVVAIAARPAGIAGERTGDELLRRRGVAPHPPSEEAKRLFRALDEVGSFTPPDDSLEGPVPEGAYREGRVLETNSEGVFCALAGRRLPAKRHPLGIQLRIEELLRDEVVDDGGGLWHRRIEEIDAAATALCAHRYAIGHAFWLGSAEEGVLVLPGSTLPERFPTEGVIPPVERLKLPPVTV